MDKFFSIFGKTMLVLLVLAAFVYGGYYFGTTAKNTTKPMAVTTEDGSNLDNNTYPQTQEETPVATSKPQVTLVAGVSKSAGLSFDQYSIVTPNDWISKKESQSAMDEKLVLTKDGYEISIFQAATGGALCLYPGDAPFEGPSSTYEVFTNLTTKDGKMLRRSGDKNGLAFTICQKSGDNSYQQPTSYGHASVKIPANYTPEMLTEVDNIISSLKKI